MNVPFVLKHAYREGRSTWRRLGLYMGSITLGVAALVAINSFRTNIIAGVHSESRNLLGADLELHSRRAFPDSVRALLDSLTDSGVPVSYLTTTPSMAVALPSQGTRLVQLKAVSGDYPYYGDFLTDPPDRRGALADGPFALVDPGVTVQLDVAVGDTLLLGFARFVIAGVIQTSPGEVSFQSAMGPRVFIPDEYLDDTGLVQYGSLVRYQAFVQIPDNQVLQAFLNQYNQFFRDQEVGYDTVAERVEELTFAVENMTRFLGLVGLTALLLGGVGVASAVHVYTKEKLDTVAVLRCLGATQKSVFGAYLIQAGVLGLGGAAAGVLLGVVVQLALPRVLDGFLPLAVDISVDWWMVATGLFIGLWVAVVFSLLPLLDILDVTPLRALRREFDQARRRRGGILRIAAYTGLAISILTISLWQAPVIEAGFGFGAAVAVTTGLLWITARLLIRATRRYFPRRARYVVRQGVANLFRPQNQTVAVTIALGFGVFLIATIYIVQRNILDKFDLDASENRPNVVAFDIQADQRDRAVELFRAAGHPVIQVTPIIPARLSHINGRTVDEIVADTTGPRVARWAMRREYRHTYRDTLVETEELIAGEWWDPSDPPSEVGRISLEQDIANDLHVGIGDHLTWNIQGVFVETQVANIRTVNWARFEPNFFVVFEPGSLADAPTTFVTMARIDDETERAVVQRDLVRAFPNISIIDLGLIQSALDDIIGKVTLAIRFMAMFSIASGIIVLIGAIGTSRYHRIRESVLLKTLGATARQIGQIFSTEYAALGTLAGLTGVLLASVAGWLLVTFLFELEFTVPASPLIGLWIGVTALTTGIGILSSRKVAKKPPLAVIREIAE